MITATAALIRRAARPGWRRWLLAAALGGVAVLALPPFYLVPVLIPSLAGLLWLIAASRDGRAAFAVGWWFGFGHFIAGLYWIANAFGVAGVAEWAAPLAVLVLAATAALFIAAAALGTKLTGTRGAARVIVFAVAWTAAEWARGSLILGGFPWNLIGYGWCFSDAMIQMTAVTGIYGLSLVTVFAAATPAAVVALDQPPARKGPVRWWLPASAALGLALIWLGGAARLPDGPATSFTDLRLRLVQANIAQHHKWRDDLRARHLARHLEMTAANAEGVVTHVIWPETAMPFSLDRDPAARQRLAEVVPPGGLLLTGVIRVAGDDRTSLRIWNSLSAIDETGTVVGTYDKSHLVPFGEYVPLRGWLPIAKLTAGTRDFSAGPGPRTLDLPGLPGLSPLICYEAIFPGRVRDPDDRPDWLLNITNDGWYGFSTGPFQHMAQARLRAVEEGLALVRAANTGISAVVDPYGRVVAALGLAETGVLDSGLPRPLVTDTIYRRVGDWPLLAIVLVTAGWMGWVRHRGRP
ncbi:MAG: apolipoprotein N-acyltransferase [Alphaproteobacteria bacterium]|nr:apolipoprotein N-acyltransferase [Alphaproteobacteria bacterium]MDP6516442.1 apolipoprotein N-acyltransferase [Alphaproteobacteria bacterium]